MLLAHLPAGYLLGKVLTRKRKNRWVLAAAMLGGVFPDFDLAYFYLVDGRAVNHHHYWFHTPSFWLAVLVMVLGFNAIPGRRIPVVIIAGFFGGVLLHHVLDSVAASIFWLRPCSDLPINLISVDAHHEWWVWNFVLHPSFLIELGLIMIAAGTWWGAGRARRLERNRN